MKTTVFMGLALFACTFMMSFNLILNQNNKQTAMQTIPTKTTPRIENANMQTAMEIIPTKTTPGIQNSNMQTAMEIIPKQWIPMA